MPNHEVIYQEEADRYELFISKQPDLRGFLDGIRPLAGLDVLDMGAGSGRLTCSLAPAVKFITALDKYESMLKVTAQKLQQKGLSNWRIMTADHRELPVDDQSIDLVVSGWSICYLTNTDEPDWRENLQQIIDEIKRVLRPGGTVILIENYGSGSETPNPPASLQAYFHELEHTYGFTRSWIRTDYSYDSEEQAEELTRFFFGNELADQVRDQRLRQVPECAAIFTWNA